MAEGQTRLNQQVVESRYWDEPSRLANMVERPWATSPGEVVRESRLADIRRAVETDIIPRVVAGGQEEAQAAHSNAIGETEVRALVRILLSHDDEGIVSSYVAGVLGRGATIEQVYLQLFQPAARYIGELWCDDLCSFVDVTLATGTLQRLLRTLGPAFHRNSRAAEGSRQALLVPLPGDQHTFGLTMVAEFFRRAGWSVWSTPFVSRDGLCEAVQKGWFAVAGFSASCEQRLDELAAVIQQTRRESCNSALGILVGGPLFVAHPEYVARVGADDMGADAPQALDRAERFVAAPCGP